MVRVSPVPVAIVAVPVLAGCRDTSDERDDAPADAPPARLPPDEWRALLSENVWAARSRAIWPILQ